MKLEQMKPQVKDMTDAEVEQFVREYRKQRDLDFQGVVLKSAKRKTKARSESAPLSETEVQLLKALGLTKHKLQQLRN